jgi:hypothetical protein
MKIPTILSLFSFTEIDLNEPSLALSVLWMDSKQIIVILSHQSGRHGQPASFGLSNEHQHTHTLSACCISDDCLTETWPNKGTTLSILSLHARIDFDFELIDFDQTTTQIESTHCE